MSQALKGLLAELQGHEAAIDGASFLVQGHESLADLAHDKIVGFLEENEITQFWQDGRLYVNAGGMLDISDCPHIDDFEDGDDQ